MWRRPGLPRRLVWSELRHVPSPLWVKIRLRLTKLAQTPTHQDLGAGKDTTRDGDRLLLLQSVVTFGDFARDLIEFAGAGAAKTRLALHVLQNIQTPLV